MTRPTHLALLLLLLLPLTPLLGGCYQYTIRERDGSVRHLSKQEYQQLIDGNRNRPRIHVPNDL